MDDSLVGSREQMHLRGEFLSTVLAIITRDISRITIYYYALLSSVDIYECTKVYFLFREIQDVFDH